MTDAGPPDSRPARPTWAAAYTGAAGAAALLGLAASGRAEPLAAGLAAGGVALVAAWQTTRAMRRRRFLSLAQGRAAPAVAAQPFGEVFEKLPDPVLIVTAEEADEHAAPRVAAANAAARERLRIPAQGGLLAAALRRPEVLEAIDESLFGSLTRSASWESGGAQDRAWRAWSAPLPGGPAGMRQALVVIHEETDARRAERTRADFMANASHELRTPLASLAGFIETLRGHAKDDEGARERFLHIMASQAARMSRLVEDLLSLSRIELNEHIPPAGVVDLAMATVDVCDALAPLARERAVTIELRLPERGEARIPGDRDQLVQVVQNLVDNAVKYSARGGVVVVELATGLGGDAAPLAATPGAARLSLLTPDPEPDQRYAALRVTDAGPGIGREHLPRLTERFYRVEGQKSGDRPGTGLGLSIVKHVVNRHRGGLAVDSTPGRGATFIAYFPVAAAKVAAIPVLEGEPEQPPAYAAAAATKVS